MSTLRWLAVANRGRRTVAAKLNAPSLVATDLLETIQPGHVGVLPARELREQTVRIAEIRPQYESESAAISAAARKRGITTPETVRKWVSQAQIDPVSGRGITTEALAKKREHEPQTSALQRKPTPAMVWSLLLPIQVRRRTLSPEMLDTLRNAPIFGAYLLGGKGTTRSDVMFGRVVSDDYNYMAGMVYTEPGWCVYIQIGDDRDGFAFRDRGDAEQYWEKARRHVEASVEAHELVDMLPNISRTFGWCWFRNLDDRQVIASFQRDSVQKACLRREGSKLSSMYSEYMERGIEKHFDNHELADSAFLALQSASQDPNPSWVAAFECVRSDFFLRSWNSGPIHTSRSAVAPR